MAKYTYSCNKCDNYARPPGDKPPVFNTAENMAWHLFYEHDYLVAIYRDGERLYDTSR